VKLGVDGLDQDWVGDKWNV